MSARKTDSPIRAALYARVSTTHGQDPALQMDELRQVAAQRGWRVAAEYADVGVSGTKDRRPALDRLMSDARAGRLDLIAVWRFDRFARSTRHMVVALDEFRALSIDFVSIREAIDTSTSIGKVLYTLISAISEMEAEAIRERVVAGVRRAQAAGKHVGRPRQHVPVDAAVALLGDGRGLREVATMLGVDRNVLRDRLREARQWPQTRHDAGGAEE
jgi:DNA invertase Pin-like site-specific DNA recombinase